MDRNSLEQKRDEAEKKFNELQTQEADIQKEMLRQQGAYQLAVQLLKEDEALAAKAPEEATTVTATEDRNK